MSFFLFSNQDSLAWIASLRGVTSLIFLAKAKPIGQGLMIVFSLLYGILSFQSAYYGKMITYVGMRAPMALITLISWLRHPFEKGKSEVQIEMLGRKQIVLISSLSFGTTVIFYWILKALHPANLGWSTVSVFTSSVAVLLTFWRSPYYALGYANNDVVLIILWVAASDIVMSVCFLFFS
ncbi:nicotinamide riboside transporter PnuC [Dubosiella newyorkensis]|jgi:nicotinamide mononucleotide transporter|uniref:nicotinamide riboside transporter PnuC n=1 Tax=Dubosiella newyorkensis TaxID=1862672 RepID=UPI0023568DEE|nr:nicotinamide riboside transporter PnuC [Dubosiella newyorkensis]MCI9040550.1 nicotinamide mononucleotide transporter [Dubosiella newyorkensis]